MIISLQRGQFYPEGNISSKNECKLKDIFVSLENKEPTSQEKLEERTKLRQFNTYLHNLIHCHSDIENYH